tara:strand:+ start:8471 stop:9994 length:1524 start_codon:yes stop_codon:yes gene_type:complete
MPSPGVPPTAITPPRVPLINERTGLIDRAWYLFLYNLYSIVGSGTGIIPVTSGGTGLSTIPTNGQLLIGNGTGYTLNTLGFGAGISVTNGAGTVSVANTGVLSFSTGTTGLTPAAATTGNIVLAGTLAIANGGTNGSAAPTAGAVAYGTGTAYDFTAAGTSGYFLKSQGAGTPIWSNNIGGYIVDGASPYLDWGNGSAVTLAAGRMWYDGATGAWNLGMGNGNITQQVGEEIFVYGKASAAITDSPLQIIYHTGTVGASGTITFAPTIAGLTNVNDIVGVATESLALNDFGRATVFGVVRGITTNGTAFGEVWADDDPIWYNPVTGNPTKVIPEAPNIKVQVGVVIKAGAGGSGSFQVSFNRGSRLGETDSNVKFGTLANNDLIVYDTTVGYWKNIPSSTFGVAAPVTKTADFTVATGEIWYINNKSGSTCVVTLPAAASWSGRQLSFKNMQAQLLNSASSNVVPIDSTAAGTSILLNVVGNWATMVSDGTNWVIMQAASNNNLLLE